MNHYMISEKDKLSEILKKNIDLLPVVYRFGISTSVGSSTIKEICMKKKIETSFFLVILNTFHSATYFPKLNDIDLLMLIKFLKKTHDFHKSVTIPRLNNLINDLVKYNPDEKIAIDVKRFLDRYIKNLLLHISFEEKEIFPLTEEKNRVMNQGSVKKVKALFRQHTDVESEISDLIIIIIQHIPKNTDIALIHDILHTLSHFAKEQADHARFEEKILAPKLMALLS